MHRCVPAALVAAALLLAAPAFAEPRPFPATALRGELRIGAAPEAWLNGQPARLAPGARIRGADNMLRLPGTMGGQTVTVHYTVDLYGGLLDVWVLTPEEQALKPWPRTAQEAAAWRYDPLARRWSQP